LLLLLLLSSFLVEAVVVMPWSPGTMMLSVQNCGEAVGAFCRLDWRQRWDWGETVEPSEMRVCMPCRVGRSEAVRRCMRIARRTQPDLHSPAVHDGNKRDRLSATEHDSKCMICKHWKTISAQGEQTLQLQLQLLEHPPRTEASPPVLQELYHQTVQSH
jgi:hypothetical protein